MIAELVIQTHFQVVPTLNWRVNILPFMNICFNFSLFFVQTAPNWTTDEPPSSRKDSAISSVVEYIRTSPPD